MDNIVIGSMDSRGLTIMAGYFALAATLDRAPLDPLRIYHQDKPAEAPLENPRAFTQGALLLTIGELRDFLMRELSPREWTVLMLRYGLDGTFSHSLEACGRELSISRERVRQVQAHAIDKLRAQLPAEVVEAIARVI